MRIAFCIVVSFFLVFAQNTNAQTLPFKADIKWGVKENDKIIIKPVYDTVFNFDNTGKVCLACFKAKTLSANRFIKTYTAVYSCNYLNKENKRLELKTEDADTCTVFTLGKTTIKQYNDDPNYFVVSSKNKKYLVNKNFEQQTFKGYTEVFITGEPKFFIAEIKNDAGMSYAGLINSEEELVVPFKYSGIKINPKDSLIVGCSAGVGNNGDDDIYDYTGKKINSSKRHIDMATKNFIIHKIFEPKEYYIAVNLKTKEETNFNAEDLVPFDKDDVLIKIKAEWYVYNLVTKQKKPYKK